MEEFATIYISAAEEGKRLDGVLADRFSHFKSRSYFERLFEQGHVLLNGKPVKKRMCPKEGDEVEIFWICAPELNVAAENIPLDILYEDDSFLVINKPAGMCVHPGTGNWTGTFVNALLYHCQQIQEQFGASDALRPGIVHRLDKDTTGLLIAAKTSVAHRKFVEFFAAKAIEKEYLAICVGKPGDLTIDLPIGRHPVRRKEMAVSVPHGRQAITRCKTLAYNDKSSLVALQLVTGRTHQLRVHLKAQRTPILGDPVYGLEATNRHYGLKRQMLHAYKLRFPHPLSGEILEFKAPLPEVMRQVLKRESLECNILL